MFRRLQEQNHYQVLEVAYDASSDEIQSAYEVARDIYSHDALVSGSILSEHERRRTFDRIAEAYQTLIAEESRRLYDQRLGIPHSPPRSPRESLANAEPVGVESRRVESRTASIRSAPIEPDAPEGESAPEPEPVATASESDAAANARPDELPRVCPIQLKPSEEATGAFLKKAREALGLELATISEETKIGRSMLEYIENERLDRLPAPVYLRNFTRQIACCLGLDEERVASSYLDRVRRRASN